MRNGFAAIALPAAIAAAAHYTVHQGDSLTKIAAAQCGNAYDWSGIAAANRATVANPDVIYPGQSLKISCTQAAVQRPAAQPQLAAAAVQPQAAPKTYAHTVTPAKPRATGTSARYTGSSSVEQCIIARESGGNPDVWNPTGHYGLYQFSAQTWAGSGGNPADFGHASAAEQKQVFNNAVAARGYSDWTPYDGC